MQNGLKYGVSLQCLLSSWSKNFKLRTLTKCQNLNSLLTVNKRYIQLLLVWFHFLDLLIKFMKMMLLYILYCSPTPDTVVQGSFVPFAILHAPIYWSPPPPAHLGGGGGGPITGHVFGWRWERGETGITPPHAGWPRMQKILVFVMLSSHAERPRTELSLLFCNFFYNVKIIEKSLFYEPEIGFIDKITS